MKTTAVIAAIACTSSSAFAPASTVSRQNALNLKVGEIAPDFALVDQNGKTFKRSAVKKPLVVYFYPADSAPESSVQAKAFQEEIQSIRNEFKADVVGISGQGAESTQKFAQELGLDFSILSDERDIVRKEFGVPTDIRQPGSVTYVLDKDGACTSVYDNLADLILRTVQLR
eukprot:scaffold10854_cov155-Skeletonema_dohrnii-CCMP3373.AAC.18